MKRKTAFLLLFLCGLLSFASATVFENLYFSGSLKTEAGVGLWYTDYSGDFTAGSLTAQGELKGYFGNSNIFVDGRLIFDATDFSSENPEVFSAKIKEAWYLYDGSWWSIKIGRQISTWGAADGLTVTNVLCPNDYTVFSSEKITDQKIGIDAVKLSFGNAVFLVDAYYIPFFTPSQLPLKEGTLMNKVFFEELYESGIQFGKIVKPAVDLKNSEYALKAAFFLPFADFSFYGFYGFDDLPIEKVVPLGSDYYLFGEYKRLGMAGFDSSIPIKDFTLRLEAAVLPEKCFTNYTESIYERHTEVSGLAGLDWMKDDWTVSAQYYGDWISGSATAIKRDKYEHSATLNVSRTFSGGNLEIGVSGVVGLNYLDSFIQPKIDYAFTDNIKFSLSAMLYNNGWSEKGNYGKYRDLSSVILSGKFSF